MPIYLRPDDVDDALRALAGTKLTIIAGGTDFYPARVGKPLNDDVLDITRLRGLRGIADAGDHYRIGALTTWTEVIETALPAWFDGLKKAAREVGGVQIQNAGTIAGNICNASPAADGVPPLMSLDAAVELSAARGTRTLPLGRFITGNRRTMRAADEIVSAILIPKPKHPAAATFLKLGARRYLVISIVMVAAVVERAPDDTVAAARIAVGSCAAVAQRLPLLEAALAGRPLAEPLGPAVRPEHLSPLTPIDDVRGTADYRKDAALVLVRRALDELRAAR